MHMSAAKLHIISFDNPYPPNYGGVIDVFYKLKALHEQGVKVTLHAFEYGRTPARELNAYCEQVHYYERRTFVNPFIGSLPYIVTTRRDDSLLENLLKDEAPILFEGLHTCYYLDHPQLKERFKAVRMHNIEHEYYARLEDAEGNFFKKYFFSKESARLKEYESILQHADLVLAISPNDEHYLRGKYSKVAYVPAFHANDAVRSIAGQGDYIFYHGKLSVGENDEAARFLVNKVFNELKVPLFIAGHKPSSALKQAIQDKPHIKIFEHLSTEQISELIQKAQVNILPTFQSTGIKLKLINVLFQGRFVIANDTMVSNTGLEALCIRANSPEEFRQAIHDTMVKIFQEEDIRTRTDVLQQHFDNRRNAEALAELLAQ